MPDSQTPLRPVEDWQHGGFGLYLHWPFCQSKCPYCDFNSHVATQIDQSRWARAYLTEIERVGIETKGRALRSVFFGGGTPSLMDPELVAAILDKVRSTWPIANNIEITLEANPTSVEAGRFTRYKEAGVNRVSMGIQALSDTDLRGLGRLHTVAEAMRAFEIARCTFDRVSFDLIYARQNQSASDWEQELKLALGMAVDHLSLYQLTIEDGTSFGDRYATGRLRGLPSDDQAADMFNLTQALTAEAGFFGYEVSNHAKFGHESRHNQVYWRYGDYAGIGPGAHGRLTIAGRRFATVAPKGPAQWLTQVERTASGEDPREMLSASDQFAEAVMMGMRLHEGVDLDRLEAFSEPTFVYKIKYLSDIGMIEVSERRMRTTAAGRPVLNAVLRHLLAD